MRDQLSFVLASGSWRAWLFLSGRVLLMKPDSSAQTLGNFGI